MQFEKNEWSIIDVNTDKITGVTRGDNYCINTDWALKPTPLKVLVLDTEYWDPCLYGEGYGNPLNTDKGIQFEPTDETLTKLFVGRKGIDIQAVSIPRGSK